MEALKNINWKATIYNFVTSKTIQAASVAAVVGTVWPPAGAWIGANPEIITLVFGFLRLITKDSVIVKKEV